MIATDQGVRHILEHLKKHMLRSTPSEAVDKYKQYFGASMQRKLGAEDIEDVEVVEADLELL